MAKLKSNFKNILLCLLIISALMAAILGTVYALTQEPIAHAAELKKKAAIEQVLPSFDELKSRTAVYKNTLVSACTPAAWKKQLESEKSEVPVVILGKLLDEASAYLF